MTIASLPFRHVLLAIGMLLSSGVAFAQDRLPPIPADRMTDAQREAAAQFRANRGVDVFGPFVPLLHSPEVMLRAMALGDHLRYKSVLAPKLRELAILVTARVWTQQYEWDVHLPIALSAGLGPEVARAIAEGRRPPALDDDEEIVYELSMELHRNQSVSDVTYRRALERFGEQGTIDLVSINGYYTLLAMVLNTARTPLDSGRSPGLSPLPR